MVRATRRVAWSFPDGNLDLKLEDVAAQNAEVALTLTGSYRTGPPGVRGIDITMRAARAHGPAIYKYIPHLPPEVAEWLRTAIVAGAASDVRVRLRGDLDDFPFRDVRKGEFKISGRVTNAQLAYAPDWPQIDDIDFVAAIGKRKRDAAAHAAGAHGSDPRCARHLPSRSRSFNCACESPASPSASSVRGPSRRSRPRIAPARASNPFASGASHFAQRATEARNARPSTVSSVM